MDYKKYFSKNNIKLSDRDFVAVKLGGLITAARLHSFMSQAQLAKKISTQQPSLARAESGEVVPSVEFLYKIAKALKTEFIFPKFGFMEGRTGTAYLFCDCGSLAPYFTEGVNEKIKMNIY
ncbi:MAG TPA: helix-turn-helix transcriptional regulator [Candidatus Paceibacterota bacterium]